MVSSILTNNGAMTALQSLKATQKNLLDTQNRISTGLKVSNAKDNAATWAVATSMRSDIANFKQVSENLSIASSVIATARSGTEQMADLLKEIQVQVTSAQDTSKDPAQIQGAIDELVNQVKNIVTSSSFKGVNLIDGSQTGNAKFLASVTGTTPSYIEVANKDLRVQASSLFAELANVKATSVASQEYTITAPTAASVAGNYSFSYLDKNNTAQSVNITLAATDTADSAGTKIQDALRGAGLSASYDQSTDKLTVADVGPDGQTFTAASALADGATTPVAFTPTAVTAVDYAGMLAKLDTLSDTVTNAGAAFGSAGKRVDLQKDFMDKLVDTLTSGVGALVDADMSEEAARLQALQVQEQLGTQALSIANQAPQSILSLFRG